MTGATSLIYIDVLTRTVDHESETVAAVYSGVV